jgi:hypothetical protein
VDVLASTPREYEDWIVAEVTAATVRLQLRDTGASLRLRREGMPPDLKPGDVLRMSVGETA